MMATQSSYLQSHLNTGGFVNIIFIKVVRNNSTFKVYSVFNTMVSGLGNGQLTESYTVTSTAINCSDHIGKVPTECTMAVNVRIPLSS